MCSASPSAVTPYSARQPRGSRRIFASTHEKRSAHSGRRTSECVTPRWFARYSTGPTKATTKSRSGAAQAKNPAAMRRGNARGGASFGAVARARSAPESAWVRVSTTGSRRSCRSGDGRLLHFDVGLLHHLAPACDLVLEDDGEFRGRAPRGLETVAPQNLFHVLRFQRLVRFLVEAFDDVLRQSLGAHEAVPISDLVARIPRFAHRGYVGRRRDALGRGDREGSQASGLDVLERRRDAAEDELSGSRDRVVQGRSRSLV